jgi:membrane protease YdiL (CAAX protease family)
VIYAWIYNSTGGSLLAVMVAHAGHNLGTSLVPDPSNDPNHLKPIIDAVLYAVVALVVVVVTNHRTLIAKRSLSSALRGTAG